MYRLLFLMMLVALGCGQFDLPFAGKSLTLGFYPPQYEGYGREDWDSMKLEIGRLARVASIAELDVDPPSPSHHWFLINRLPRIQWTVEERKAVSSYLGELALKILYGKKYDDPLIGQYCGLDGMSAQLSYYPAVLIWAALQIDPATGFKTCEKVFQEQGEVSMSNWSITRDWLLVFLGSYFKEEGFKELVKHFKPLNKTEAAAIAQLLFNNEVFNSPDQMAAWQKIWEDFEGKNEKPQTVATMANASALRSYNLLMLDCYGTPSIDLVLDLVDMDTIAHKKYLFLSASCFLANYVTSTKGNKALDSLTYERLQASVDQFYQQERRSLHFGDGNFDFLEKSYHVLIASHH